MERRMGTHPRLYIGHTERDVVVPLSYVQWQSRYSEGLSYAFLSHRSRGTLSKGRLKRTLPTCELSPF